MPQCGTPECCTACKLPYDSDAGFQGNVVNRQLGYVAEENKYEYDSKNLRIALARAGLDSISPAQEIDFKVVREVKRDGKCV